jgi:L-amino acid N-acyltransferase YncA
VTYHVRAAGLLDARALAELLNEIIAAGDVEELTGADISHWMLRADAVWHLVEDELGRILGVQYFDRYPDRPEDVVDVASFVRAGGAGPSIGSMLFEQTKKAARARGYRAIDAIIRADNEGGLAYYQSRGFETIKVIHDAQLDDVTYVDKVWKRYDLR